MFSGRDGPRNYHIGGGIKFPRRGESKFLGAVDVGIGVGRGGPTCNTYS